MRFAKRETSAYTRLSEPLHQPALLCRGNRGEAIVLHSWPCVKRSSGTRRGRLWISSESWRIAVSPIPTRQILCWPNLFISARLSPPFPSFFLFSFKALHIPFSLSLSCPCGHCARYHSLVPEPISFVSSLFFLYSNHSLPSLVIPSPSFPSCFHLHPIFRILPYLIDFQPSFPSITLYSTSTVD